GDIYYTLDGFDPRAPGGTAKGLKYTKAITLENSSVIKTRFISKNFGIWSALAEKPVLFDGIYGEEVVINEIMYHPQNGYPEFVEIFNTGVNTVVLDGFVFTKGVDFTFNTGSNIYPKTGLVLTNDTSLFKNVYGFSVFGQFNKRLSNSGETLILKNRFAQTVDSVSYSDSIPWPKGADGDGYSLELINPLSDNSVYNNWKESDMINGTPFEPKTGQELHATLYPNPFNQVVYIEIGNQGLAYEPFIIEVFNLFGSKVKSLEISSYYSKIQIPTDDLSQGVYIIHLQPKQNSDFKVQSLKAIKL
ncbi:MAG: lamin tail domain-containing protein, partial [Draconibacterium sp.]|nr:lamin tail domain-containing protein [Draconibacterium sp.]